MSDVVALIGCGGWGKNLGRNLHQLGALYAIVDPDKAAFDFAKQLGVRHFATPNEVFTDDAVRAVAIATPAATHFEVASAALTAGKDVFIEKPIALDVEEGKRLSHQAKLGGRVLMVGHLLQYHPVFLRLLELVRTDELGAIRHIISNRLNFGLLRTEENVLWSFAPHDISMVLALADGEPIATTAIGSEILQKGIPDVVSAHLEFSGGITATITSSWLHPEKEQKLTVIGDSAMAVFDDRRPWDEKLTIYRNQVEWPQGLPRAIAGKADQVRVPEGEPLRDEMQHFLSAVKDRAIPRTDAEEAIRVLRVLEAAQRSFEGGGRRVVYPVDGTGKIVANANPDIFRHETAIVDDGATIGRDTKIWHFSHILGSTRIGERCVIGQNVMIGPDVSVGNGCKIQNNVAIYKGVTLEDDVFCGPSMVFTNVLTPRAHIERKEEFAQTVVGKGATLGANCTIVCGNQIGRYAMVGAGAVVTKDVPDFALVVGNPARQIGWVSRAGDRLGADHICPRTGERYHVEEDGIICAPIVD